LEAARQEQARPYRILVAEDSPTQRQIIMTVLNREGHEVIMAEDGIEAFSACLAQMPDLVVLDIEMPKMNGYQVCRLLKDDRRTSHIPVIMLTSKSQETDKYWGLKTGADRYVTKDFKLTGLANEVSDLLSQEAAADRLAPGLHVTPVSSPGQEDTDVLSRVNDLLDRKLYEATIINEVSRLNTLSEDSSITIDSVLSVIARVTDCDVCAVVLAEEKEIFIHTRRPISAEFFEEAKSRAIADARPYLPPGTSPASLRLISEMDPMFLEKTGETSEQILSTLTMPLAARGEIVALMTLFSAKKDAFTEEERLVLDIVAHPASIVVDNARLHEGTKRMAITDGLTKLINHRHFYELLAHEFQRTCRYKAQISLIMFDIDYFKHVNDTYGHQVGDEILQKLAELAMQEVREVDILARYGGEEFAVLLPQTGIEQAQAVAERIRMAVERHEFSCAEGKIRVTVSLGVAGFPATGISSQIELVQEADAALYRAKKTGKNRVETGESKDAADAI